MRKCILFLLLASTCACNNNKTGNEPPKVKKSNFSDSCLHNAILKQANAYRLRIVSLKEERLYDTVEVSESLRRIYFDTPTQRIYKATSTKITIENFGDFNFSEYFVDLDYYQVIKSKDSIWSKHKVEGPFWFKVDTGEVKKPHTYILKGPPVILFCDYGDTLDKERKKDFLLSLIPAINECRGTDHW